MSEKRSTNLLALRCFIVEYWLVVRKSSLYWWSLCEFFGAPGNNYFCRVSPVTLCHALSRLPINVNVRSEQFPVVHLYNLLTFNTIHTVGRDINPPMSALEHSSKRQRMQSSFAPAVDELHLFKRRWAGWTTIESEPVCTPSPFPHHITNSQRHR